MIEEKFDELCECRFQTRAKIDLEMAKLAVCERKMLLWDSTQTSSIVTAVKGNGAEGTKPLFSNAEASAAELLIRQMADPDYVRLFSEHNTLKASLASYRSEVEQYTALIDFAIANAGDPDRFIGEVKTYVTGEVNVALRRAFSEMATPVELRFANPDAPK